MKNIPSELAAEFATVLATKNRENSLRRLYWVMRIGMAVIWIWTAYVSWFVYPQAESLEWLHRIGLGQQAYLCFIAACLFDFGMGIASAIFSSRRLWQWQILAVILYTCAILIYLPEFLTHPFGPLIKNIAVLACLAYLTIMEPIHFLSNPAKVTCEGQVLNCHI